MIRIVIAIDLSNPERLDPPLEATAPTGHHVTLLRCSYWARDFKNDRIDRDFSFRLSSPSGEKP